MDDAELSTLEVLRQHGVGRPREVHTYVGHVDELGELTFRIEDAGLAGDRRWFVQVTDALGQQVAGHEAAELPEAVASIFGTIRARVG